MVTPDRVIAVDFKTNAVVPETVDRTPAGLVAQMAAYQAVLTQIYPDRPVQVGILWTATRQYLSVPQEMVNAALRGLTTA